MGALTRSTARSPLAPTRVIANSPRLYGTCWSARWIAGRGRPAGRRRCPPRPGGPAGGPAGDARALRPPRPGRRAQTERRRRATRLRGRPPGVAAGEDEQRREAEQDRAGEGHDRPRRARVERAVEEGAKPVSHRRRPRCSAGGRSRRSAPASRRPRPAREERAGSGDPVPEVAVDRRDLPAGEDALDDADVVGVSRAAPVEDRVAGSRRRSRREDAGAVGLGGREGRSPGAVAPAARRLHGLGPFVDGARVGVGRGAALQRNARPLPDPGDEQRAPFDARPVGVAVRPRWVLGGAELALRDADDLVAARPGRGARPAAGAAAFAAGSAAAGLATAASLCRGSRRDRARPSPRRRSWHGVGAGAVVVAGGLAIGGVGAAPRGPITCRSIRAAVKIASAGLLTSVGAVAVAVHPVALPDRRPRSGAARRLRARRRSASARAQPEPLTPAQLPSPHSWCRSRRGRPSRRRSAARPAGRDAGDGRNVAHGGVGRRGGEGRAAPAHAGDLGAEDRHHRADDRDDHYGGRCRWRGTRGSSRRHGDGCHPEPLSASGACARPAPDRGAVGLGSRDAGAAFSAPPGSAARGCSSVPRPPPPSSPADPCDPAERGWPAFPLGERRGLRRRARLPPPRLAGMASRASAGAAPRSRRRACRRGPAPEAGEAVPRFPLRRPAPPGASRSAGPGATRDGSVAADRGAVGVRTAEPGGDQHRRDRIPASPPVGRSARPDIRAGAAGGGSREPSGGAAAVVVGQQLSRGRAPAPAARLRSRSGGR